MKILGFTLPPLPFLERSKENPVEELAARVSSLAQDTFEKAKGIFEEGEHGLKNLIYGDTTIKNRSLPSPPFKDTLRVMSYNIYVKGDLEAVKETIRKSGADLVGLQECTPEKAEELADALNMHVIHYSKGINAGKAILSRYPIESGEHVQYPDSLGGRLKGYAGQLLEGDHLEGRDKWFCAGEPLEERGILLSTVKVGDKTVDILDTHLALRVTDRNSDQLRFLDEYAKQRRALGHEVVVMGDFNTNFNIQASQGGTQGKDYPDPTDTLDEYRDRYGRSLGNIGDRKNLDALNRLRGDLNDVGKASEREVIDRQGRRMTLEEAREELKRTPKSSERYAELVDLADGNSNTGDDKRYDSILTSLEVKKSWIDFSAFGSDHQPVLAEISFKQ